MKDLKILESKYQQKIKLIKIGEKDKLAKVDGEHKKEVEKIRK